MKIWSKTRDVLSYALLGTLALLLVVIGISRIRGEVPSLFGYSMYSVATGSMSPELEVGDIILAKQYKSGQTLAVGDVITYRSEAGVTSGKLITHKIVSVRQEDGETVLVTKGTANHEEDAPITDRQVVSVTVCKLHIITWLYGVFSTKVGFILLYAVPMGCFIVYKTVQVVKECKRKDGNSQDDE